ncbi:MAG: 2-oxoacid:acceptor oxidoreductase family protein [Limnochordales bacterium]|nr:ferredoxin [Bacillota bacterium]REJ33197.1 MAG: ferredoxin [Bacillota bacterium]
MPVGVALPVTNEEGFFEIRLESIGGLGANVAGKILAEAGVLYSGLNGSNFASYGSEKKGTPVKSFIRFAAAEKQIRNATPVERPHVLGIFHEALVFSDKSVLSGLYSHSVVVINSRKDPETMREMLGLKVRKLGTVPALDIATETGSRTNMAMLGAITKACEFLSPEGVVEAIRDALGTRYPQMLQGNLEAFWRGYHGVKWHEVPVSGDEAEQPYVRPEPLFGYETATIGGTLVRPGTTWNKDMSASRQGQLPEFLRDKCIDCAQCDLVCPDYCFVWEMGQDKKGRPAMVLKGIDYQYCKGCLKCVEACPVDALVAIPEADGWAQEHRVQQRFSILATAG